MSILVPADNTPTHLLTDQSPAINAGDNTICANSLLENVDQRGQDKQINADCNIGSIELAEKDQFVSEFKTQDVRPLLTEL